MDLQQSSALTERNIEFTQQRGVSVDTGLHHGHALKHEELTNLVLNGLHTAHSGHDLGEMSGF